MSDSKTRELIDFFLKDEEDKKLQEEEILHLLIQRKVSQNINSVQKEELTFGQRMADRIAQFAGSWRFIIIFTACLIFWIVANTLLIAFDGYPFILLNLVLSCVAAVQAPVIMMSQNRQEEKDRLRSQNDYLTNLKTEIIIEDLHQKLDQMLENQDNIMEIVSGMERLGAKEPER